MSSECCSVPNDVVLAALSTRNVLTTSFPCSCEKLAWTMTEISDWCQSMGVSSIATSDVLDEVQYLTRNYNPGASTSSSPKGGSPCKIEPSLRLASLASTSLASGEDSNLNSMTKPPEAVRHSEYSSCLPVTTATLHPDGSTDSVRIQTLRAGAHVVSTSTLPPATISNGETGASSYPSLWGDLQDSESVQRNREVRLGVSVDNFKLKQFQVITPASGVDTKPEPNVRRELERLKLTDFHLRQLAAMLRHADQCRLDEFGRRLRIQTASEVHSAIQSVDQTALPPPCQSSGEYESMSQCAWSSRDSDSDAVSLAPGPVLQSSVTILRKPLYSEIAGAVPAPNQRRSDVKLESRLLPLATPERARMLLNAQDAVVQLSQPVEGNRAVETTQVEALRPVALAVEPETRTRSDSDNITAKMATQPELSRSTYSRSLANIVLQSPVYTSIDREAVKAARKQRRADKHRNERQARRAKAAQLAEDARIASAMYQEEVRRLAEEGLMALESARVVDSADTEAKAHTADNPVELHVTEFSEKELLLVLPVPAQDFHGEDATVTAADTANSPTRSNASVPLQVRIEPETSSSDIASAPSLRKSASSSGPASRRDGSQSTRQPKRRTKAAKTRQTEDIDAVLEEFIVSSPVAAPSAASAESPAGIVQVPLDKLKAQCRRFTLEMSRGPFDDALLASVAGTFDTLAQWQARSQPVSANFSTLAELFSSLLNKVAANLVRFCHDGPSRRRNRLSSSVLLGPITRAMSALTSSCSSAPEQLEPQVQSFLETINTVFKTVSNVKPSDRRKAPAIMMQREAGGIKVDSEPSKLHWRAQDSEDSNVMRLLTSMTLRQIRTFSSNTAIQSGGLLAISVLGSDLGCKEVFHRSRGVKIVLDALQRSVNQFNGELLSLALLALSSMEDPRYRQNWEVVGVLQAMVGCLRTDSLEFSLSSPMIHLILSNMVTVLAGGEVAKFRMDSLVASISVILQLLRRLQHACQPTEVDSLEKTFAVLEKCLSHDSSKFTQEQVGLIVAELPLFLHCLSNHSSKAAIQLATCRCLQAAIKHDDVAAAMSMQLGFKKTLMAIVNHTAASTVADIRLVCVALHILACHEPKHWQVDDFVLSCSGVVKTITAMLHMSVSMSESMWCFCGGLKAQAEYLDMLTSWFRSAVFLDVLESGGSLDLMVELLVRLKRKHEVFRERESPDRTRGARCDSDLDVVIVSTACAAIMRSSLRFDVLGLLLRTAETCTATIKRGGLAAIVDVMKSLPGDESTQIQGLFAFRVVADSLTFPGGMPSEVVSCLAGDVMTCIVAALRPMHSCEKDRDGRLRPYASSVVSAAFSALASLCCNPLVMPELTEQQSTLGSAVVSCVASALSRNIAELDALTVLRFVLNNWFVGGDVELPCSAIGHSLLERIPMSVLEVMYCHPGMVGVQEAGCEVLAKLSGLATMCGVTDSPVHSRWYKPVLEALCAFPGNVTLQVNACKALVLNGIIHGGGRFACEQCGHHFDVTHPAFTPSCAGTVLNDSQPAFLSRSDTENSGRSALLSLLSAHPDAVDVQLWGWRAAQRLTQCKSAVGCWITVDAERVLLQLVLRALERWLTENSNILAACCGVLFPLSLYTTLDDTDKQSCRKMVVELSRQYSSSTRDDLEPLRTVLSKLVAIFCEQ